MILGVAQVVFNVSDLDRSSRELEAKGYRTAFAESELPSHPAKSAFRRASNGDLEMVHLASPNGGLAIEFTHYPDSASAGATAYRTPVQEFLDGGRLAVSASAPEASTRFWCEGAGFREEVTGGRSLTFAAALPAWRLTLDLTPAAARPEPTTVDAHGCVLVTLLSTNASEDRGRLAELSTGRVSDLWEERVGGRDIRVAIVEGPSGELLELLELGGRATR